MAELIFQSWPLSWSILPLIILLLSGLAAARFHRPAHWLIYAPMIWFGWQLIASAKTIDPQLTRATLFEFALCIGSFYLGFFSLGEGALRRVLLPVALAFAWMLMVGFDQHYGGLEATRKAFYELLDWQKYPQEYIKKIASDRIFSTMVYPNALAVAILLLGPTLTYWLWQITAKWHRMARAVLIGLFAYASAACFFWTGSKGGWLVALGVIAIAVLCSGRFPAKMRLAIILIVLVGGSVGFLIKFSGYLKRGAPSASARIIYWTAGVQIAREHPFLGTGPGTFGPSFKKIKPPDAEMARLTHNDYLEQASDSGLPGAAAYLLFIWGALTMLYRLRSRLDLEERLLSVGALAWALQSFVEFNLYIPALGCPAFLFLGYLFGRVKKTGLRDEQKASPPG